MSFKVASNMEAMARLVLAAKGCKLMHMKKTRMPMHGPAQLVLVTPLSAHHFITTNPEALEHCDDRPMQCRRNNTFSLISLIGGQV